MGFWRTPSPAAASKAPQAVGFVVRVARPLVRWQRAATLAQNHGQTLTPRVKKVKTSRGTAQALAWPTGAWLQDVHGPLPLRGAPPQNTASQVGSSLQRK